MDAKPAYFVNRNTRLHRIIRRDAKPETKARHGAMGFYDLMSQQKELYDSHLTSVNGTILNTITNPNDTRFVVKGKFTETHRELGKVYYLYSQIYYSTPQRRLMIDGLIDFYRIMKCG